MSHPCPTDTLPDCLPLIARRYQTALGDMSAAGTERGIARAARAHGTKLGLCIRRLARESKPQPQPHHKEP